MYYIGLDVHKKTISYCVKDASGRVHQEGRLGATRCELDIWMRALPQPWTVAMEATIFTGWIYDHLHPHATEIKVAHPLMLRAIAAAKKKNDRVDARFPSATGRSISWIDLSQSRISFRSRGRFLWTSLVQIAPILSSACPGRWPPTTSAPVRHRLGV
jgi:Transposase